MKGVLNPQIECLLWAGQKIQKETISSMGALSINTFIGAKWHNIFQLDICFRPRPPWTPMDIVHPIHEWQQKTLNTKFFVLFFFSVAPHKPYHNPTTLNTLKKQTQNLYTSHHCFGISSQPSLPVKRLRTCALEQRAHLFWH